MALECAFSGQNRLNIYYQLQMLEQVCCNKPQKKSQPRNWFGDWALNDTKVMLNY